VKGGKKKYQDKNICFRLYLISKINFEKNVIGMRKRGSLWTFFFAKGAQMARPARSLWTCAQHGGRKRIHGRIFF
jgi:hypothetical protein